MKHIQYAYCLLLGILLSNMVNCDSFNKNNGLETSIKVKNPSITRKDNWIQKIIDINSFKKSREEAYLSNFV